MAMLAQGNPITQYIDCKDYYADGHKTSGVYAIHPDGTNATVEAYCEMEGCENREEGGGWTVFQKRIDGTVNFYRPWEQYKEGFGNPSGEYWLGLENLYQLTSRKRYQLRVDIQDFDGSTVYALYSTFTVGGEDEGYKLSVTGFKNRGAGDSTSQSNGMKFSTFDKDQDVWVDRHGRNKNCAASFIGAFWYRNCGGANPNGVYLWGANGHSFVGVVWNTFRGSGYSQKTMTMLIRPVV
ncbi:microfibril-associated glycoprotein 4-like [Engraulis encrasicolus]|uniref:microfibril-associated glycoprotein 4-like n=1 Tax=Engraulis encrasicolus TaxID=184585 RepID=UPI002FCF7729